MFLFWENTIYHYNIPSKDTQKYFLNLENKKKTTNNIFKSMNSFYKISLNNLSKFFGTLTPIWGCPRGVMVKAMVCGIVVREFILQSRYYVHFRANTLGKGMNPLILPAMG